MTSKLQARKNAIVSILGIAVVVYLGICALLFFSQRSMIYYPTAEAQVPHAEDLRIASGNASIQVWRVGDNASSAVLYFGGNAEDVSGNIDDFVADFAGHTVYLANYRGYGASTGVPSEEAILRDAETLFDEVSNRHRDVMVVGRSLGSGVAVHLGTAKNASRLVLITPYDSLVNVAAGRFPVFPVSLLLRDRFDSVSLGTLIDVPTLVVAAEHDEIIPIAHARALADSIRRDLLEFIVVEGAGHNTIGEFADYRKALTRFVRGDDHQI